MTIRALHAGDPTSPASSTSSGASCGPAPILPGLFPPYVRTVGIVSLSSIAPPDIIAYGTGALKAAGYRLKVAPNVPGPEVAPPAVRARLFEEAWLDPEIDFLLFMRGGEGAVDAVPLINWERLRVRDMCTVGFSDVTIVIHAMMDARVGHPFSGPSLRAMSKWSAMSRDWFSDVLAGRPLPELRVTPLSPGAASGLPIGGHLERVHRIHKLGRLPSAEGRIFFLECPCGDSIEKLQSFLTDLRDGGALDGAAAVAFGDMRGPDDSPDEIGDFLPGFAATLPCPVFAGVPYGHIPDSITIDFRRRISLAHDGTMTWEPAVSPQ